MMHINHRKLNSRISYENSTANRSTEDVNPSVTPHIYSGLASFKQVPPKGSNNYVTQKFTTACSKNQSQPYSKAHTGEKGQQKHGEYDLYSNADATTADSEDMYNHIGDRDKNKSNSVNSPTSENSEYDHLRR